MPDTTEPSISASVAGTSVLTESPLLYTKLRVPSTASALLPRPRLASQLELRSDGLLTLLSAPAGFGKTTLVASWFRQQSQPVAWVTLDEQDNDPILFWRYLIAALQEIDGRLGRQAQAALATPPLVTLESAVALLINDFAAYSAPETTVPVVLDDFQWIHNGVIHQSLNFLLQHQPPQLHLFLLTRADPPLSLARLRVEGRLVELRATDMRLSLPEMTTFLNEVMALGLSDETLALLAEQTEGWMAGIQLAARSLHLRDEAAAASRLQSIAGARQHVFAYLMEEV
ncbi:MAG: AAA family ATPase, partial [Chloroflexota bacterium]